MPSSHHARPRHADRPDDRTARHPRRRFVVDLRQPAPAAEVFPQLCPTREYDWIEYWRCRLLYSESGFGEEDCIFATDLESHEMWVVTRYEPPERIEFCIITDDEVIVRLKIRVSDRGDGTSDLRWERIYTAIGPRGRDRVLELASDGVEGRMREVNARLAYFLTHGEMLHQGRTRH